MVGSVQSLANMEYMLYGCLALQSIDLSMQFIETISKTWKRLRNVWKRVGVTFQAT